MVWQFFFSKQQKANQNTSLLQTHKTIPEIPLLPSYKLYKSLTMTNRILVLTDSLAGSFKYSVKSFKTSDQGQQTPQNIKLRTKLRMHLPIKNKTKQNILQESRYGNIKL